MNRRTFLALMAAAPGVSLAQFGASPGLQPNAADTVVLELANFHCPRCYALNAQFERFQSLANAAGMDFRFAPVGWEGQSQWPDRVYYAIRDLYPRLESFARNALYDGVQKDGLRFEEISQVEAYFRQREIEKSAGAHYPDFDLKAVIAYAQDNATLLSEGKAWRLVEMSGATEVPVVLWISGGEVSKMISPHLAQDPTELSMLIQAELSKRK